MWQEAQGHGGIWLERHVIGEPIQRMHLTASAAGGEEDQEGCPKSEVLQRGPLKRLVRTKSREDQEEAPGGVRWEDLASARSAPLTRFRRKGSPEKVGLPIWRVEVQTADQCILTKDAERPLSQDRRARKFAKRHEKGLWRGTKWSTHNLTQLSQCTEYTPWLPGQWACSIKQSTEEEEPREDSRSRTEARHEGAACLGVRAEPLTWDEEQTEGPAEAWWTEHDRDGEALETRPGLASEGPLEWGWPFRLVPFWELSLW